MSLISGTPTTEGRGEGSSNARNKCETIYEVGFTFYACFLYSVVVF
jgi:hypothetical protein